MSNDAVNDQALQDSGATGSTQNSRAQSIQHLQTCIGFGRLAIAASASSSQASPANMAAGYAVSVVGDGANVQPALVSSATGFIKIGGITVAGNQSGQSNRGNCSAIGAGNGAAASIAAATKPGKKYLQLPKVPANVDKQQRNWMEAISAVINESILGAGSGRALTVAEAVAAGVIGQGPGGSITQPPINLTVPAKITGLTARGAMTTIILNWNAPSFANFGLVEIWRSDKNNIGEAFRVGTSVTNFFQDPVGTGATKYYWARAVTSSGVAGEFNTADGTLGKTSLDPTYVMQLLTSQQWAPNNTYQSYQYVRGIPADPDDTPFAFQNFQYVCLVGGISGVTEPTWPVIVGDTVIDGTVTWQCRSLTEKVPFTIGLVNGVPSVVMSQAFIEDASINTAQIHDLAADKITAGELRVGNDIQVGSKIWGGFSDFDNIAAVAGFWLGLDGGLPRLALDTGGAPSVRRYIRFNGLTIEMNVDIFSGADGYFDDLLADSLTANRAAIDFLSVNDVVVASDKVRESPIIPISEPEYLRYLCYPNGVRKTERSTSPNMIIGTGYSRDFAFYQTPKYNSIKPYDYSDASTKYRARKKNIGFSIKITGPGAGVVGYNSDCTYLDVYIFDETQSLPIPAYNHPDPTHGIPSRYLAKIPVSTLLENVSLGPQTITALQNMAGSDVPIFDVDVSGAGFTVTGSGFNQRFSGGSELVISCADDEEWLGYSGNRRLKVAIVYKVDYAEGGSGDDTFYGSLTVDFQIDAITPYSYDASNDAALTISSTTLTSPLLTTEQNTYLLAFLDAAIRGNALGLLQGPSSG